MAKLACPACGAEFEVQDSLDSGTAAERGGSDRLHREGHAHGGTGTAGTAGTPGTVQCPNCGTRFSPEPEHRRDTGAGDRRQ